MSMPRAVVFKALLKSVPRAVIYLQYYLEIGLSLENKSIIQPLSAD